MNGNVRDMPEISIRQCDDCGLVFLDSFEHINDKFYEESKMREPEEMSVEQWELSTQVDDQRRFKLLKDLCTEKDIMDFGAGNGGFLKLMKSVANSTLAIELDLEAHEIYEKHRISYYNSLDNLAKESKFDVITAFHVIEHLKDPVGFLKNLGEFLRDDGSIF